MERRFGEEAAKLRHYSSTASSGDHTTKKLQSPSLTVFARHRIQQGKEHLFEAWIEEISTLQETKYAGYRGVEVVKPTCCNHSNEYVSIFRYDTYDLLQAFMNSEDRQRLLTKTVEFEEVPIEISYHSLEFWFLPGGTTTSAGSSSERGGSGGGIIINSSTAGGEQVAGTASSTATPPLRSPSKLKMTFVTYCLIFIQAAILRPILAQIPKLPAMAVLALNLFIIVVGTTYVWMPLTTQYVLHWWLFPKPRAPTAQIQQGVRLPRTSVPFGNTCDGDDIVNAEKDKNKEIDG
jgi:antibiotic biosynthesis monooxygenase (ABM) superfamily enzyme